SLLGASLVGRAMMIVRPAYLVGVPLVVAGCVVMLFVNIPTLMVVLPLITLMGVLIVGFFVATQTLIQLNVGDQYRGRVASALGTTTALLGLLGMLTASTLGDLAGPVSLLDGTASLHIVAGVVAMVLLRDTRMQIAQAPTALAMQEAS